MRFPRRNLGLRLAPSERTFPSRPKCKACAGRGSWQTHRATSHGPADGEGCEVCEGRGFRFSPECKAVARRRVIVHHHIERNAA